MNLLDILGAAIGLVFVFSEYKASRWLWPSSLLMAAFYAVINFRIGWYANAGICVYNFLISIYGLLVWRGIVERRQKMERRHPAGKDDAEPLDDAGKMPAVQDICIPTLTIVASERADSNYVPVLCDCWVFWYTPSGDTLKCVSGGNHAGAMTIGRDGGRYKVTGFEQTVDGAGNVASAKRIFGGYYDIYENIHSSEQVREAVRQEQLREYVKRNKLAVSYYQDYGWPAVKL